MPRAIVSRRSVLVSALAATAGSMLLKSVSRGQTSKASKPIDYSSREAFDLLDRTWSQAPMPASNEGGQLGWGRAWLLQAYVLMYQTHRDPRYLDRVIEEFDAMLKIRDNARCVRDYRGLSLPAWRCTGDYTCGEVVLNDSEHRPALRLRTAARPSGLCSVSVVTQANSDRFKLIVTYPPPAPRGTTAPAPIVDVYDDLSLNPAAENYAPRTINARFAEINGGPKGPRTMLTANDVRTAPPETVKLLACESNRFSPIGYVYAVQTGQITYPAAGFARVVLETPSLAAQPKLRDKAHEYLEAIQLAVDGFDHEWRQNGTEGWYIWAKGAPIPFDGSDQPHNQYLSLARTMVQLAALAPRQEDRQRYRDRATRMARTFKNDLKPAKNGGVSWTYFWTKGKSFRGWTAAENVSEYQPTFVYPKPGGHREVEDISHAQIDIDLAMLTYADKYGVFDDAELRRFATTFRQNVLTSNKDGQPTVFENVDGSGKAGIYDSVAACWAPLARYEPQIFSSLIEIYSARPPKIGSSSRPLGVASLNAAARAMKRL